MIRRRTVVALLAFSLALLVRPIAVLPAAACSCGFPDDVMGEAAKDPQTAVFTGIVGLPTPEGVPVDLTRWFEASLPGEVVFLDSRGFEDPNGGSCGTTRPPAGSEWIFVSGLNERGRFDVGLCTIHADLATDQGQTLLAEAAAAFGPLEPIPVATAPPAPASTPRPVSSAAPADSVTPGRAGIPVGVMLMAGGAGLVALLGAALLAVARRRGGGDAG
jgi:hypothetical protein